MNKQTEYDVMSRKELIDICKNKDYIISKYIHHDETDMLGKHDIMEIYDCESNKALRILRLMFQMGYGNKIGKEYYVSRSAQAEFVKNMAGKEVYI